MMYVLKTKHHITQTLRLVPRLVLGGLWTTKTFLEDLINLREVQSYVTITSPCPKTRAWGAVDRHNIPKGSKSLHKDLDALHKGLGALLKGQVAR
jgi:hypothetical protein